ncbi:MAG: UPF0175 family protein [Planctomycetaceae bacterium]|nr:UPF0175 family protein [Planctomycetaceae bacterium]
MTLEISIPDSIADVLRAQLGARLEQKAKEDLAVQWYRDGLITSGQVAELLGTSWSEAQAFLKEREAGQSLAIDDVIADADRLRELRRQ